MKISVLLWHLLPVVLAQQPQQPVAKTFFTSGRYFVIIDFNISSVFENATAASSISDGVFDKSIMKTLYDTKGTWYIKREIEKNTTHFELQRERIRRGLKEAAEEGILSPHIIDPLAFSTLLDQISETQPLLFRDVYFNYKFSKVYHINAVGNNTYRFHVTIPLKDDKLSNFFQTYRYYYNGERKYVAVNNYEVMLLPDINLNCDRFRSYYVCNTFSEIIISKTIMRDLQYHHEMSKYHTRKFHLVKLDNPSAWLLFNKAETLHLCNVNGVFIVPTKGMFELIIEKNVRVYIDTHGDCDYFHTHPTTYIPINNDLMSANKTILITITKDDEEEEERKWYFWLIGIFIFLHILTFLILFVIIIYYNKNRRRRSSLLPPPPPSSPRMISTVTTSTTPTSSSSHFSFPGPPSMPPPPPPPSEFLHTISEEEEENGYVIPNPLPLPPPPPPTYLDMKNNEYF